MGLRKPKKRIDCPLCTARGKTRTGQAPTCAFRRGRFYSQNWMCATMLALRDACKWSERDDFNAGSIGVIAMPDTGIDPMGYLVLTWYKDRGSTPGAVILGDMGKRYELTLARARRALEHAKKAAA